MQKTKFVNIKFLHIKFKNSVDLEVDYYLIRTKMYYNQYLVLKLELNQDTK